MELASKPKNLLAEQEKLEQGSGNRRIHPLFKQNH